MATVHHAVRTATAPIDLAPMAAPLSASGVLLRLLVLVLTALLVTAVPAQAQAAESTASSESLPEPGAEAPDEPSVDDRTFEQAVHLVEPSVVYLDIAVSGYVRNGTSWLNGGKRIVLRSSCSGTIVHSTGYVLTAGHCVDPAHFHARFIHHVVSGMVERGAHLDDDGDPIVTPTQLYEHALDAWEVVGEAPHSPADIEVDVLLATEVAGRDAGRSLPARVVDLTPFAQGDVAFVKVEQTDLPVVPLAAEVPGVGSSIIAVGFPGTVGRVTDPDLNAAYKDGRISQHRTKGGSTLPVWEISAAVSGGMSGGPTINLDGEIVGVNSYKPAAEEQQFNFIAPVQLVRELAARNGLDLELDELSDTYREGVAAYYAGDHGTAVERFDAVLEVVPSHVQARELRRSAMEADVVPPDVVPPDVVPPDVVPPAEEESAGGVAGWVTMALVAAVMVALTLGALLILLLRKQQVDAGTDREIGFATRPVEMAGGVAAPTSSVQPNEPSPVDVPS